MIFERPRRRSVLTLFLFTTLVAVFVGIGLIDNSVNAQSERIEIASVTDGDLSPSATFGNGNLAVLVISSSANNATASIVELSPTVPASNPVQTINIDGTGANAMRFSGSASSTGYLTRTNDGTLLTFNGANNTNTVSNVNTLNPRAVGTLNNAGTFTLQTTYTGTSGNQTRSSTSINNTNWAISDQGGIYTNGTSVASPVGNTRSIKSFGGIFYVGQSSSTVTTIQVNTLSAISGGTITGLPGLTNNSVFQDFHLISSGDNGSTFDVLYVTSATSATVGSVAKYSLVAGSWVANGTYTTAFGGFGITAADNGAGAKIYVSTGTGATAANSVLALTDTAGYNATIAITTASNVTLYTAAAGTTIKGVSFAPVAGSGSVPTISENTASHRINLPANAGGALSGTVGDTTDPGLVLGVDLTIADADTPIGSLTVTAASSNQTVVPAANLNLTGMGATRNLKITPAATGYSTITVTVSDGTLSSVYTISYAASTFTNGSASPIWHTGKSDASTAVLLDGDYMLVADDEDQTIRLYDRNNSGAPVSSFDFTSSLGLTDLDAGVPREVDIEASARVGNRIYWLGSHSNSAGGNNRPNRSRVFATDISGTGAATTLTYVGRFDGLKSDLIAWDSSGTHGLGNNFFGLLASSAAGVIPEAPDGSGWNIEGLVFAPDDSTVYIGFRAPIVPAASRTKALLVPVTNFTTLFTANPTIGNATFGAPIQFDLNNRGIREIKKNAANEYLIVAGRASSANFFDTYTWTGNPADAPLFRSTNLININPESIVDVPVGLNSFAPFANVPVQFLSDNGDTIYYGDAILAKDLPNNAHKKFRSDVIIVGLAPSAAGVEVSGRVLSSNGFGIGHASVFITESATGQTREFRTGSFGYFRFEDVTAGSTYVLSAVAKGRVFQTRVLTVDDNIYELDLVAEQ